MLCAHDGPRLSFLIGKAYGGLTSPYTIGDIEMKKIAVIGLALSLIVMLLTSIPVYSTEEETTVNDLTVEVSNTTRNGTGLERYRHTIIVTQLNFTGSGLKGGHTIYLNITGAVLLHATGTSDKYGRCMWEWIPENLSTVTITAEYNGTINATTTNCIYPAEEIILELEHAQKYHLGERLYMQLFSISKVGYFEPSNAPYWIAIRNHNANGTHTTVTEWNGFLDNHGYRGYYTDLSTSSYDIGNYEVWVHIYNHTGNESGTSDTLIDSDGGTTQGRGAQFEPGYYLDFYSVYGEVSNLWWYNDSDGDDAYDIDSDTVEGLEWTHTVYGTIYLVGDTNYNRKQLSTASNYKDIYFNDTDESEDWTNDTGSGLSEDIWLDDGNGIFNENETQEGYPYEGWNGTPFLRCYHSINIIDNPVTGSVSITADKWIWTSYLNRTSKTLATLYSEIPNCLYVCCQDTATGAYKTYGAGITDSYTVEYGTAIAVLVSSTSTWGRA